MNLVRYRKIGVIILLIMIFMPAARGETIKENKSDKKYGVLFSGSWNSLRNEKLNDDFIETWKSWGVLDDKINSGNGFSSEIFYQLSRKFSISAGLIYIESSTKKNRLVRFFNSSDSTEVQDFVKTSIYAPTFSVRYHVKLDRTDFVFGISESFLLGKASIQRTTNSRDNLIIENVFHSTGIGFRFFTGIHYRFNGLVSYIMEAGYKYYRTGDLVEKETELTMKLQYVSSAPLINLDYSGPYISAGLMFRLF